jgi:hypothetical protein
MKKYECPHCPEDALTFSAEAKWDVDKQEFVYELDPFYFDTGHAFCKVCDHWVNFVVTEE